METGVCLILRVERLDAMVRPAGNSVPDGAKEEWRILLQPLLKTDYPRRLDLRSILLEFYMLLITF